MAKEALKKLEEQLNCSICLDTYTDPKLLQCFHVYCQLCLVPLVKDNQGQLSLTCPTCRQVTPIPDRGVAGLQSAFHINHLLEIQDSFRKIENQVVTPEEEGAVKDSPSRNVARFCSEHFKEELKLYCETCGQLTCLQCVIKGSRHHDHDYAFLEVAFAKYKEEITSSLEPMEKQVTIFRKALAQLNTRRGEISDQQEAVKDNIHVTFRRLREVLNVRETEVISQLHQMTQEKLQGLADMSNKIATTITQLSSCLHFMKESLTTGNEGDVLTMKTNITRQVQELIVPVQQDMLQPNAEADMIFSALEGITAMCQDYGEVFASSVADPSNSYVTRIGIGEPGNVSTVSLRAINFGGRPCVEPIKLLECELVSEITGNRVKCGVEKQCQNEYEISYMPITKGRHQLHVKVEGQHVRGSPFSVEVKSPVEKLGTPILTIGGVERPWGVVINKSGEIVVTESLRDFVSVLTPGGKKLRSFGTRGSGEGEFRHPNGITVDGEGNILVADYDNHRIQKFTPEGQFLTAVGTKGSGSLQFTSPIDIACSNNIYVVDSCNHRIQALDSDLAFSRTYIKEGSGKGQLRYPCGVACDNTGKMYVADYSNHHIQVFTAEGKFLRMFGKRGQGKGELDRPGYVAVDAGGQVYVSEGGNCRVSVFTSEGQFLTSFGKKGTGPGEFSFPSGLAVDNCGVVYVCDLLNNCIQVF